MQTPVFNIVSDRRGGRTAWSSTVTISGQRIIQARYWYDGQYVNNAKEDAAEVALQQLTSASGHLVGAGGMGAQTHHAGGLWRGRDGLRGMGIWGFVHIRFVGLAGVEARPCVLCYGVGLRVEGEKKGNSIILLRCLLIINWRDGIWNHGLGRVGIGRTRHLFFFFFSFLWEKVLYTNFCFFSGLGRKVLVFGCFSVRWGIKFYISKTDIIQPGEKRTEKTPISLSSFQGPFSYFLTFFLPHVPSMRHTYVWACVCVWGVLLRIIVREIEGDMRR